MIEGPVIPIPVVASAVKQPTLGSLLLSACHTDTLVGRLVVGERDELSGEEASFVEVEVEGAALDGFDPDGSCVEEVEELFEFAGVSGRCDRDARR
ncbi:MAG: hypothetical protein L0G89_00405 [Janibacter sp.]|nr:hypothetical protein [Janibacter sp.]MDN5774148.1 hypothetical protein [Brevibacterium aurantiacum]